MKLFVEHWYNNLLAFPYFSNSTSNATIQDDNFFQKAMIEM